MGIKKVVERRVYLWLNASMQIPNAAGVTTIRDLLSKATPLSDPTKILKCKVCQIMVDVWGVLQVVVANVSIGKDVSHNLQQYLDLMMRVEAMMRRKISKADALDKNAKSIKLPGKAMDRCTSQVREQSLRSDS